MANVVINDANLTNIADAIRSKNGLTETYKPSEMAAAITAIPTDGSGELGSLTTFTGNCGYLFANSQIANHYLADPTKLTFNDVSNMDYMFHECRNVEDLSDIKINLKLSSSGSGIFAYTGEHYNIGIEHMFRNCVKLKEFPQLVREDTTKDIYAYRLTNMFYGCYMMRELPTWFKQIKTEEDELVKVGVLGSTMFRFCRSLRNLNGVDLKQFDGYENITSTGVTRMGNVEDPLTKYGFSGCYVIEEILNVPLTHCERDDKVFTSSFVDSCHRLKRLTFYTRHTNLKIANETIDLTNYVGYVSSQDEIRITNFNSGITASKKVYDDASYQALKNDPDWYTTSSSYSRYNKTSAIQTINSLPDTSSYLSYVGGTNTIKFKGTAGTKTDGGAINTMTAEQIAVATAKGWTVAFV